MQLNEIYVNQLGVLKNVSLKEIPGLSVVHGDRGSGKTMLVQFVRDSLLATRSLTTHNPDEIFVGSIQISEASHRWTLASHRSHTGEGQTTVQSLDDPDVTGTPQPPFPDWISKQTLQEVLCPGRDEADQFALLTRLCLKPRDTVESDSEIDRVRQAIAQAACEREGTALESGVIQQITELSRQRDVLKHDLENMKRQDFAHATPTGSSEQQIADLQTPNLQIEIEEESERIDADSAELEHRSVETHERNRLALDQNQLRVMMANLTTHQDRWSEIRVSIDQETAALCQLMTQQQKSAPACELHLESQLSSDASTSIQRVESLLQDRINALQEELDHTENTLSDSLHHTPPDCESAWRQDYRNENESSDTAVESFESQPRFLHEQHSAAFTESATNSDEKRPLTARFEDIQPQTMPSLEEIDDLQARLAEVEARLELQVSRHDVLLKTEQSLGQVVTRLSQRHLPTALEIASPWLSRLTDGECVRVLADATKSELLVETTTSHQPLRISQLSRGIQRQLALALRLALLQAYSSTSRRMPLIIDDAFITSDDDHGAAAADLLRDVAVNGQQIILLTGQNDVRALLAARGAQIYSLSAAIQSIPVPEPPTSPEPDDSRIFKAFDGVAEKCPGEPNDTMDAGDSDSHWLFYLEPEHSVSDLSGIEKNELNGFNAADLESVEQLLTCSIIEVKERIQNTGLLITEDRLKQLQTQAVMAVCIPMLRQRDAELLVAAGIDNIRQLAQLRPKRLLELIERFQKSDSGSRFMHGGRTIDQQQAISWNRWALHARTVDRARSAAAARRSQSSRSYGILSSSRHMRAGLSGHRRQLRCLSETDSTPIAKTQAMESNFQLSRLSSIEAAPSIGSKTAARLARVGVETVGDLLEKDADTLATWLDDHRITASIIEQWKSQATLVCTIPKLRGHDAQILVACEKNNANEIVDLTPEQLFSVVQSFCETTEGARIIQSERKPDLKEVTNWICWAEQSRPLKAA